MGREGWSEPMGILWDRLVTDDGVDLGKLSDYLDLLVSLGAVVQWHCEISLQDRIGQELSIAECGMVSLLNEISRDKELAQAIDNDFREFLSLDEARGD